MSVKKIIMFLSSLVAACFAPNVLPLASMTRTTAACWEQMNIAKQLGFRVNPYLLCGGYYVDQAFPMQPGNSETVTVTSGGGILSQTSTSLLEGDVTLTRSGQQITANKAYLYRDPITGKLNTIDLIGNVHLREANSLIIAKSGRYNFISKSKSLIDILYRTKINARENSIARKRSSKIPSCEVRDTPLTAWGKAQEFSQTIPGVYELWQSSYTTCPPINPAWRIKANHIVLDKNTGRGFATQARLLIKDVPVFYIPYINFPIDKQRKTGFLWPTIGIRGNWGPYVLAPFYLNMAPNYDMTITPGFLTKRGLQLSDTFRYLTHTSEGSFNFTVLPYDRAFNSFQNSAANNPDFTNPTDTAIQPASVTEAELNRLLSASDTRKAFYWRNISRFNENWSSHVDFNYAGDDYYVSDFGRTLNEISANQLLQEGDITYQSQNWNFIGRLQAYQTLHPIDQHPVLNQYRRFPQLILNADYPDQRWGLHYFINNEVTHFDIRKTPGTTTLLPIGNRMHTQPGISLPLYWPGFYVNPRLQYAITDYDLQQITDTNTPSNKRRSLPIFDIATGVALERSASIFRYTYKQTLEPQVYYTYIPYRNQIKIPIFDTTVNTLTYDQLFNYNRFTGLDRIGDANQMSAGITTRFIDQETGLEKVRFGIGEIFYFANRIVTLCNDDSCSDNPDNPSNRERLSPISAVLNYHVSHAWNFKTDVIWDPITQQLNNTTLAFQYRPDESWLFNFGYTYARSGDPLSGIATNDARNNLKVTDISAILPIFRDVRVIGRWSQNWNQVHLQNLLFGLEYDTCCWAVRAVGGRGFIGFDPNNNNRPQYTHDGYIEFTLKGLGDAGAGTSGLLYGIPGYKSQFGQEI